MKIRKIFLAAVTAVASVMLLAAPAGASTVPYAYGVYPYGAVNSWQEPTMRPPQIVFGTDGGLMYRSMAWGYWNNTSAWGRGTRWANTCSPTCAAGNYWKSPGTVTLGESSGTTATVTTPR